MSISSVGNFGMQQPVATQGQNVPAFVNPAVASHEVQRQASPHQAPSQEQIQQAVQDIKRAIQPAASNSLSFSIDQSTGKTLVKVTDAQTGDVIRQIPSEEVLDLARSIDKLQGLLVRQKA